MKKYNPHIFFKSIAAVFLAVYLIGSFTNMLYIPRYVPDLSNSSVSATPASRHVANADLNNINFLKVFDKTMVDNDAINELCFVPRSLDASFAFCGISAIETPLIQPQIHPYNNCRYSYLAFCTFRI